MSFISNASGFTLGEGTFNNIHGPLVNVFQPEGNRGDIGALLECLLGDKRRRRDESTDVEEPARKRRRENPDDEDGLEIIRHKDLNLTHEIGGGPGYLLHTGNIKRRAVIVKVFNAGTDARKHLEATVNVSQRLLHPNVLRIEGISSPTSMHHFIAYDNEDARRRTAEGPLAAALRDDLDKSIVLGFKMISSLSSGINYLNTQSVAFPLGPENFDVFLDINDRFLLSINPPAEDQEQDDARSVWTLFNALCQKVLRSANRLLHDEDIERIPTAFDSSPRSPPISKYSPVPSSDQAIVENAETMSTDREEAPQVPPRREYVWRTMDVPQSLVTIATQIARDLDLRRASINRLARSDGGSIHRCPGYVREEVTLATRTADSAVVSHDAPTIQEVCSVCHKVVNSGEVFRCVCGQPGCSPSYLRNYNRRRRGSFRAEPVDYELSDFGDLAFSITPSRSPTNADFDTLIQRALRTLSPAQIQQLMNSIPVPPAPEFLSSIDEQDSSLMAYQPPFDFSPLTSFPLTSSPPPSASLLEKVEKTWQATEDIEQDVDAVDSKINNLFQQFQIPTDGSSIPLESVGTDQMSLPDSSASIDNTLFFSFLDGLGEEDAADDDNTASTAFLDEVPTPSDGTVSPVNIKEKPTKKRKSDVNSVPDNLIRLSPKRRRER